MGVHGIGAYCLRHRATSPLVVQFRIFPMEDCKCMSIAHYPNLLYPSLVAFAKYNIIILKINFLGLTRERKVFHYCIIRYSFTFHELYMGKLSSLKYHCKNSAVIVF